MTETARVYGGSLYELAQEEHLEEEILSEMKEIRALFRETRSIRAFYRSLRFRERADRADRRGIWQPGGTVFGQFYQTAV